MIIIPEIETVVILPPKSGSTSAIKAIKERYLNSFQIYRHMEADGVPFGYDKWSKVGMVRNPIDRLWSLYKYCKNIERIGFWEFQDKIRKSVSIPFNEWIINNEIIFTDPNSTRNPKEFFPRYAVRYAIPENRKSQYIYLRPDLGTEIFSFEYGRHAFEERLGISLPHLNITENIVVPQLTEEASKHMIKYHEWDFIESFKGAKID
jgi:hypothetical protein